MLTLSDFRLPPAYRSAPSGARHSWVARLSAVALAPFRFYRARARFAELAKLDDYLLRDIGLTRQDLSNATALPRDEDPTTELARVIDERRMFDRRL